VTAPKEGFRLLSGKPSIYLKTAESGAKRAQAFCATCGTRLYASAPIDPPFFNIRVGTVRQRRELSPKSQVWFRSALPWVTGLDAVKKIDRQQAP
jgi:hypothetical protein